MSIKQNIDIFVCDVCGKKVIPQNELENKLFKECINSTDLIEDSFIQSHNDEDIKEQLKQIRIMPVHCMQYTLQEYTDHSDFYNQVRSNIWNLVYYKQPKKIGLKENLQVAHICKKCQIKYAELLKEYFDLQSKQTEIFNKIFDKKEKE